MAKHRGSDIADITGNMNPEEIPQPTPVAGRRALGAILQNRSVLPALSVFHEELGDVFQVKLGLLV